jgi:hypothetical protein
MAQFTAPEFDAAFKSGSHYFAFNYTYVPEVAKHSFFLPIGSVNQYYTPSHPVQPGSCF